MCVDGYTGMSNQSGNEWPGQGGGRGECVWLHKCAMSKQCGMLPGPGCWLYLYMRDIMWLTMWNDHDHRRAMYQRGEFGNAGPNGVAMGVPANGNGGKGGGPGGRDRLITTRREPLYFKKLGGSVVKPRIRTYDRHPADHFQGVLELFNSQNRTHKFHVIYPSVS